MDEQDDIKPDAAAVASATAAAADVHIEDANDDDQINVPVPSSDQEEHAQPPSPKITNPISVQLNKACKMEEGFDMDYKQEEDGDKKKDAGVGASSTGLLKGCNMDVTTPVWVKRKRTTRTVVSCDENTAADSLVFMKVCRTEPPQAGTETDQESCAESSGEEFLQENEEDDVKFDGSQQASSSQIVLYNPPSSSRQVFECSTCNKVFGSHQALGGHRASHKRIKGCFAGKATTSSTFRQTGSGAITKDDDTPVVETSARARKKNGGEKMHECSICLRRFSSGQALGGHKRCHWMSPNARESIPAPPLHRRHLPVKHSATLAPPPPRTTQTVEKRNTRTPPATITPTSSSSSMPNVTSASASASGSGSGGPSVNLSNLPCMDGVASDWLHLHVRRDSSVEPNDDRDDDDDDDDENDGES